jgi:hypothetical protein
MRNFAATILKGKVMASVTTSRPQQIVYSEFLNAFRAYKQRKRAT